MVEKLTINEIEGDITYIKDPPVKGDPTKIFEDYNEKNFIDFYVEELGQKIKLATYRYSLTDKPKGLIVFFHGLSSSIHTSGLFARSLAEEGYIVTSYEYRGHGQSQGRKVYFSSSEEVIEDSKRFLELVCTLYENVPIFLAGISYGGFVSYQLSLRFQEKFKFKGVILLAPALKPLQNFFTKGLASVLGTLFPSWYVGKSFRKNKKGSVTKNPFAIAESEKANRDKSVPFSTLKAVLKGVGSCEETFKDYKTDFFMVMGRMDKVIHSNCVFEFIKQAKSQNKKLYFYENLYHNVLIEEEIYDIIDKLKKWLGKLN